MPINHGEGELSEPGTPKEAERELEETRERMQKEMADAFAVKLNELASDIDSSVNALELKEFHDANLELAQQGDNENPRVAIADAQDPEAQRVINDLRAKLEKATMDLAKAPTAAKEFNLQRFLLFNGLLASGAAIAAILYTAIHDAQTGHATPPELPPDTADKVRELVRSWNAEPDAKYWTDLANYVTLPNQSPKLTLADQILFMSYTIDLSPSSQYWLWDSANDVTALVGELVDAYTGPQSTAAMYRLASTLTYKKKAIPRGVMAFLLRAALSRILIEFNPTPAADTGSGARVAGEGKGEGDGEDPLSKPAEDPQAEADTEAEEARREEDSFAARNAESAKTIAAEVVTLELSTLNCDNVELAQTQPVEVANSAVADQTPDPRLRDFDAALTRSLDTVAEKADPASRKNNVTRYLARFFGVSVLFAAAVVLLEYLTRSAKGQSTDDLPPVPEETQATIHDLVEQWKAQNDAQFWGSLATYLEQHPGALTGADQVLFMNYTIDLCPPVQPFIWDSQKDKAAAVEGLVTISRHGADYPALYRALPGLIYQGASVPRAVAADCARLAIAWIIGKKLPPQDTVLAAAPLGDPAGNGITGIPVQLRPRIHVAEVAPGVNPDAYARSVQMLFRPAGLDDPAALSAVAAYQQPATSPYRLFDPARQIAALPAAAQQSVKALIAKLTGAIEAVYPLPAHETLVSSQVTCLSEPAYDLPVGTVVYVRTTDQATVQFVLPQVMIDPATGAPSLRRTVPAPPPGRPLPTAGLRSGSAGLSIALSVAGNLAWAMPPPWGAVTSAGFTLIQLLLNDGKAGDEFSQAVEQLELFIQEQDVNHDATAIKALADWLQQQLHVLGATRVDNSQYITSALLPELRKMVSPGDGSVYGAIYDLEQHLDVPGAFDILVLGVTIYLLALKMIVQLDAQLAATAKESTDDAAFASYTDLWLADYTTFLTAVSGYSDNGVTTAGWAVRITNHLAAFDDARLSQITEPYRYNARKWVVATGGGATGTAGYWVDDWGWTYQDRAVGDTDETNFVADDDAGGDCCGNGKTHTEYRAQVQQARDRHVQSVSEQLDTKYQAAVSTIKTWTAMIQQWNEHLPPRPPTTAVRIDGWNGTAPQGNWTNGTSVAYAVAFANASGPSQFGPWSAAVPTTTNAFPTLTDLPTDPLKMATNRWIQRQFVKPDGSKSPPRIIGITDATSTTYVDKAP